MKNITTNLKKQTLTFILVLMLAFSSFLSLLSFIGLNSKKELFAETVGYTPVSISNSNFSSNSGTDLQEPNSFSGVGTKGSTISGVIDVSAQTFNDRKENYKLQYNPSKPNFSDDNKILMINNQNVLSSYGYESSTFTLEKNRYYFVSCYVFTETGKNASTASLYLSSTDFDNVLESNMENISTDGSWQEFRFYVKTADISQSTKLVLFAGSKNSYKTTGAVYFDNISCYNLTEQQYYNEINSLASQSKQIVLTNKNVSTSNGILNGDFENETSDFSLEAQTGATLNNVSKVVGIGDYFNDTESGLYPSQNPTNANRYNNTKALLVNNKTAQKTTFVSNDILIEKHKLYKLEIDVKTSSFTNGGVILKLNQKNPYDESLKFTPCESSFSAFSTSESSNSITNNWITYTFFIQGNYFVDSYANLTLGLDENAIGHAFFDNIKLIEITSSEYDNNSSNSNAKTANFTGTSASSTITNGNFNDIKFETTKETSPYKAKNWTISDNSNSNNYNGIIDYYDNSYNVFVIANNEADYQTITSANFSMSSSTLDTEKYYLISFDVNTSGIIGDGVSAVAKTSDGTTISKLYGIKTNDSWQKVKFFVKTSTSDFEANISVSLGTSEKPEQGYCYLDNFDITESSKDAFDVASNSNLTTKTDLSICDFSFKGETSTNKIYSADNFKLTKNSTLPATVEAGIVNINSYIPALSGENDYVLAIHNIQDAYSTLKSNGFRISSGNYYKATASVRVYNLKQDEANKQYDDEGKLIKTGAQISLNGINAVVENIEENNEFVTYTFYISATTDTTVYFDLSLGNENALTSGYAFFDKISLTQIKEDDFTTAKKDKAEDDKQTIIIGNTNASNEDEKNTESTAMNFDWVIVPSLIIAIALIIALVAMLVRKINFKKPVKIEVKDYDRAKTLVKEHEKREKMKQREQRLKHLRDALQQLENEIEQNKNKYKNSKLLKQDIKAEHEKIDEHIKQSYKDVNSVEAKQAERKLKLEAKNKVKQLRKEQFNARRQELMQQYLEIEKEIEAILEEERLLVAEWKAYKKQQKEAKREKKLKNKKK